MDTIYCHERMVRYNTTSLDETARKLLATTGLLGEFGETDEATGSFMEELGDFLWYVHLMCLEIDTSFEAVIDAGIESIGRTTQVRAYQALCRISETFKKVSVTKQKRMDWRVRIHVERGMGEALEYLFQRLPNGTWADVIRCLEENIDKLSVRHKRDYRAQEIVNV